MQTLTARPAWLSTLRLVPPTPDQTSGVWHVVGLKFGRYLVGRNGRDSEPCLGHNDPATPPMPEYLAERFSDLRWYVCDCRRCRGEVALVYAADGLAAVMVRDGLGSRATHVREGGTQLS